MADRKDKPRGQSRPNDGGFDAAELTRQFEQLLSTRRLTELANRSRSRASTPSSLSHHSSTSSRPSSANGSALPTYSSLRNTPKVATPPQDPASLRFRNQLIAISQTPLKYENPGLLDGVLNDVIPFSRLQDEAEEERQILQAQAASIGDHVKPEWGYQDCLIKALLRYVQLYSTINTKVASPDSFFQVVQAVFHDMGQQPPMPSMLLTHLCRRRNPTRPR